MLYCFCVTFLTQGAVHCFKSRNKHGLFLFLNSKSVQLLSLKDFCNIFITTSVLSADVNGPKTLSSFWKLFLNLVNLGKIPSVNLINGQDLSSVRRILCLGENFLIKMYYNTQEFLSDSVGSLSIFPYRDTLVGTIRSNIGEFS